MLLLLLACAGPDPKPADDTAPGGNTSDTSTGDTSEAPDPDTVPLGGSCPLDQDYGGLVVSASETSTTVDGAVTDGVVPFTVLEEIARDGDCAILRRNNPYCDPGCDPGYTCAFDGSCIPYPVNQDLGVVEISGMAQPVSMTAVFPGNTYYDTTLPHPAYTPGALLTLNMPGGVYGPAVLYGIGIEPLDVTGATWVIEDGVDTTLTWPAPSASSRAEIAVQISIDQHGVTPSVLRCSFADDGEGVISGAILSQLVSVGVTGFPAGAIERRTVDHAAAGAGCMDFTVRSARTVPVDVVGSTPCISDDDCPEGQTCNETLQICE